MAVASASTVRLYVILGRQRFLCSSGFHSTATLGMEPWSLRNIWPIHLQRLRAIVVSVHFCWRSSKRSWFEIIWGQKILTILRRFLVWKGDNFNMSFSVICQHSDPYSRVERTQLWYNFNFVCVLYFCDFHTGLSILKAFLALTIQLMVSLPAPPSCLTVLPRYVNWSVYGKGSSSTFTGAGFWTFRVITSVFLLLVLRPNSLHRCVVCSFSLGYGSGCARGVLNHRQNRGRPGC